MTEIDIVGTLVVSFIFVGAFACLIAIDDCTGFVSKYRR